MRDKLSRGEVTQDQYERFKDRWNMRAAKMQDRERVDRLVHGTKEQREHAAKNGNIDYVRAARHGLAEPKLMGVEKVLVERDKAGNATRQNDRTDTFGLGNLGNDDLFGANDAPVSSTSVAHGLEVKNPLRSIVPDMNNHYQSAATNPLGAEPEAQVALKFETPNTPATGMG